MRKLVLFCGGFAGACLFLCLAMPGAWVLPSAIAAGCAVVLCVFVRRRAARAALLCVLGLLTGLLWTTAYEVLFLKPLASLSEERAAYTVRVLEQAERTQYGWRAAVLAPVGGRGFEGVLYWEDDPPSVLQPGDTIKCDATAHRTDAQDELYVRARGTMLTLRAGSVTVTPCARPSVRFFPARLSARLQALCAEIFPEDVRGLFLALLTGVRTGLSEADTVSLQQAGVYHAVAISGMHVSILVWMISGAIRSRRLKLFVCVPVLIVFTFMTGASPSTVRAALMQALLLCAPLMRREYDAPTALAAALLLLLVQDPWCIASAGLQLSFCAVAGLVLFYARTQRAMLNAKAFQWMAKKPMGKAVANAVTSGVSCTLSATALTLPLAAYYFGYCSLIAPLSNLLILWAVTVLFAGGFAVCFLGMVWLPAAKICGGVLAWLARYVLGAARLLARPMYAAVLTDDPYWLTFSALLWLSLLGLLCIPALRRWYAAAALCGAFLLCAGLSCLSVRVPSFTCSVLDAGQGQCVTFRSGDFCAVIDCGGDRYTPKIGAYAARSLLQSGTRRVDALILTHYDRDHINGAAELMREVRVDTLYLPQMPDEDEAQASLLAAAEAYGTQVQMVRGDETLDFPGGSLHLYLPCGAASRDNNGVCVLASAGDYDLLIVGDLDHHGEQDWLRDGVLPRAELLVAGHHGAESSTGWALLARVQPEAVVVSVGEDNPYGHPSEAALRRIAAVGASILRTDRCGTITIRGAK